jgi:CDGSH-type Zn-finger protein
MSPIVINIKNNGPYRISVEDAEGVEIRDADGTRLRPPPGKPIALCRCGQSATKPFCDATHKTAGFDGTCARQEAASVRQADGNSGSA